MRYITINHAGDSVNNPILADTTGSTIRFRATLNKQNSSETLKSCWIYANNKVFTDLTSKCVETDYTVYVDIIGGTDTYTPNRVPQLNLLYFSTTLGVSKYGFYSVRTPLKVITLDGYDGRDSSKPLIYPVYTA